VAFSWSFHHSVQAGSLFKSLGNLGMEYQYAVLLSDIIGLSENFPGINPD
jgi:hypothetical protein